MPATWAAPTWTLPSPLPRERPRISDRITVLNGGQVVATVRTQEVTKDQVLGMIILGKRIEEETEEDLASFH